jgi:hypothetical protein
MAKKAKKAAKKSKVAKVAKAMKTKATTKKASAKKPAKKSAVKKSATFGRQEWTPAVIKELKVLIKQNTPTPLIASKLDRSVGSVRNKVSKLGLSLKPTNRSPAD